jgi:hypothetical protein
VTLRTENGTETVETSASTTYTKELRTISFSDLHVGDVLHVVATAVTSRGSGSGPPTPGTGTVKATAVTVVAPSFAGRVQSSGNGTYTLVGRDGQLLTVTTGSDTRYYNGTTQASASAVSVGSLVTAEGAQSSLTDLTADVIIVGPGPGAPPPLGPTPPTGRIKAATRSATTSPAAPSSAAPSSGRSSATGSSSTRSSSSGS